jgi:glycerophosphoryl diester phosphodiesterase
MAWLRGGRLRWAIAGVLVVALVAAGIAAWPLVQRYTGAAPPAQFYEKVQLDPALAPDYPRVLGVAHNAGNNLGTLATALHYGADVIEIDVISARGQLVAGRDQWWPWLAQQLFQGPTLAQAWNHAAAAGTVKLDLKQTDHSFLEDLVAFLAERAGSRRVMVSSRDPNALLYLHSHLPDVILLFSVAGPDAVHQLQSDPALQKAIGGVSVFQGLADVDLVTWLHQHKLLILAWTVNDSQRLNQLVRLGVDGITTGNLAILRASGNQRRRGAPRKVVCAENAIRGYEQRRWGHHERLTPPAPGDQPRQCSEPQPVARLVANPADLAA